MIVLLQFVLNDRAVFTVNHEHGLLDLDSFDFIGEYGKRIEAELFEVSKALRMNDAGIAVGGKIKRLVRQ